MINTTVSILFASEIFVIISKILYQIICISIPCATVLFDFCIGCSSPFHKITFLNECQCMLATAEPFVLLFLYTRPHVMAIKVQKWHQMSTHKRMFAFLICSTIIHVDQAFKTEGSTFEILNEYAYLAWIICWDTSCIFIILS